MSAYRALGLIMVSASLVAACSSAKKIEVGSACELNSDCKGSLVCTMGKCHDACHTSADCPTGQSCVKTADSVVCQLPAEANCSGTSLCGSGLSCAPDQHCRTACVSAPNCTPGQVCANNFCAETSELVDGGLPQTASSDAGTYDASSPDLPAVSSADATPVGAGPETGTALDASDVSFGLDAPAATFDVAGPDLAQLPPDSAGTGLLCASGCNDNLTCTTDSCVNGVCQNTVNPGYCQIDKTCYMDGDTKPGDACQACTITTSTSLWTAQPEGSRCGTGKSCQARACTACGGVGQVCCGTAVPGTCMIGAACNAGTNKCEADKAIDISSGGDASCALFKSGRVRCWGQSGTIVGATTSANIVAPPVPGIEDAVHLSVGPNSACVVRSTGAVSCWGNQLPGGGSSTAPALVPGITNAKLVSVAVGHACVRTSDSKALCWGDNSFGQRGDIASSTSLSVPQAMPGATDVRLIAACNQSTCVLRAGGQISCTGVAEENGQSSPTSGLTDLPSVTNADTLTCATDGYPRGTYCAVTQLGTLICWGAGAAPATVLGLGQIRAAIGNGWTHFAIQQDGSLWAFGNNTYGELGDGTFSGPGTNSHTSPRLIHGSSPVGGVVAVASSGRGTSTCLLREDGSVSCAGNGYVLGDGQRGAPASRAYFVPVVGILPVSSEDGQCFDGVDNDGDGKTDLDDPDCAQDLGSAVGTSVATVPFAGVFGDYLNESCNKSTGFTNGPEAVFVWTAPSGGTYQFDTIGSSFDTVLAVFKGNPTLGDEMACNDNGTGMENGASSIQVKTITGDKLTVVVDSKDAPRPPASLNLNITKQ